jgi:hypothetical protein
MGKPQKGGFYAIKSSPLRTRGKRFCPKEAETKKRAQNNVRVYHIGV